MTKNKKIIIGLIIATGALTAGGLFLYSRRKSSDTESTEVIEEVKTTPSSSAKPSSKPAAKAASKPAAKPAAAPKQTSSALTGKNVASVLLKSTAKELAGLKVYAAYDGSAVYNTVNNLYTKTKKGQLLGTFSHTKTAKTGGYDVYLKTTSSKDPFVWAKDSFLTF